MTETATERRARLTTVFGWIAGASLALLINYGVWHAVGESYPTVPTTFGAFVLGAFGGMRLSDRLGARGFRPLGIAAGVLLSVTLVLALATMLGA